MFRRANQATHPSAQAHGGKHCEQRWLTAAYDEFHEPIYRYIFRRVGDVETARELTADVFQRLVQVVCRGNTIPDNPRAWLYQTAHNLVIDEYRRRQHRQHIPLSEAIMHNQDDPLESTAEHMAAERIRNLLKLLTPEQQQVITLKFLEGFSNQEVAEITGKSIGSIKALQHRALYALHQLIEPPPAEQVSELSAIPGFIPVLYSAESL